jgi:hypothetical protein
MPTQSVKFPRKIRQNKQVDDIRSFGFMLAFVGTREKEVPVVEAVGRKDFFSGSNVSCSNKEHPILLDYLNLSVTLEAWEVGHLLQLALLFEFLSLVVFRLKADYIVGFGNRRPA